MIYFLKESAICCFWISSHPGQAYPLSEISPTQQLLKRGYRMRVNMYFFFKRTHNKRKWYFFKSKSSIRSAREEQKNAYNIPHKLNEEKHTEKILPKDSLPACNSSQDIDIHPLKMIRTWEFQIIWIAYFCLLFCINAIATIWKVSICFALK